MYVIYVIYVICVIYVIYVIYVICYICYMLYMLYVIYNIYIYTSKKGSVDLFNVKPELEKVMFLVLLTNFDKHSLKVNYFNLFIF